MSLQTSLTALADSIRTKSGTTESLSIDGMKTAVDSIQTGGAKYKVLNGHYLYYYSTIYNTAILELIKDFDFSENTNAYFMFASSTITNQYIDFESLNMPNCTDYGYMFNGSRLTYADLSVFDFNKATSIKRFFGGCIALKKVWIPSTLNLSTSISVITSMFNNYNGTNLNIYTDAVTKPDNWGAYWNYISDTTQVTNIHWGATHDEFLEA